MRPSESLLEPANVYGNQDCWLETTHLIVMSKDPPSLMDTMALKGTFGGGRCSDLTMLGCEAK